MSWDDFHKYYDWEFSIVCTRQRHDAVLWKKLANRFGGPILELGCGSGRITIPLAEQGYEVNALDISERMLFDLQEQTKHLPNIKTVQADMTDFSIDRKFNFAFIAYSSFQLLLTLQQQKDCLKSIHTHLNEGGILAMDIAPCICEGTDILRETHEYTAEYPVDDSTISMFTSYRIDRLNLIKHYKDRYVKIDAEGIRSEYNNKISLKECSIEYMTMLFESTGFEVLEIFGDFEGGEVSEESYNIIYIVKKK